jgi:hypothetical protein
VKFCTVIDQVHRSLELYSVVLTESAHLLCYHPTDVKQQGLMEFEPKHAMIVQNKDKFRIPLNLSTLPTPKEGVGIVCVLSVSFSFRRATTACVWRLLSMLIVIRASE